MLLLQHFRVLLVVIRHFQRLYTMSTVIAFQIIGLAMIVGVFVIVYSIFIYKQYQITRKRKLEHSALLTEDLKAIEALTAMRRRFFLICVRLIAPLFLILILFSLERK